MKTNKFINDLLILILVTRFISELALKVSGVSVTYLWSALCMALLVFIVWPWFLMDKFRHEKLLSNYIPIYIYLIYVFLRIDISFYSVRSFCAEFIVWSVFIFVCETSARNEWLALQLRIWTIRFVKFAVVWGIGQVLVFSFQHHTISPVDFYNLRPASGFFSHANIFLIIILPFFFYFICEKRPYWAIATLFACIGTGTRSPFLISLCILPVIYRVIRKKKIRWGDIISSFVIIAIVYAIIITKNAPNMKNYIDTTRFDASTLRWRIFFWQNFIDLKSFFINIFGHGVGAADVWGGKVTGKWIFEPHNDYLRVFYDLGLTGIVILLCQIIFVLSRIKSFLTKDNGFILVMYMLLVGFSITDNFIYNTHGLFIFVFIATYAQLNRVGNRAQVDEDKHRVI